MSYRPIRFDVVDGVATITLDRPAQRNALGEWSRVWPTPEPHADKN